VIATVIIVKFHPATTMAFLLTFLLGCVDGLRSLTPPALICWAARLGWLHFAGTRLAFINHRSTLTVFTLLAAVELIADKLPKTPARTAPLGLIARIVLGGACGLGLATSGGISLSFVSAAGLNRCAGRGLCRLSHSSLSGFQSSCARPRRGGCRRRDCDCRRIAHPLVLRMTDES
jgi:uncharacterized membrane protein